MMHAYFAYGGGEISDLGPASVDKLDGLLAHADASLAQPELDRQFGVGIYRTDHDFAEVTPVGRGEYLLWSDRIVRKGGFLGFFSPSRPIQPILQGRMAALEALRCRIPDDWIDKKRFPLFFARDVLRELVQSLQSTGS